MGGDGPASRWSRLGGSELAGSTLGASRESSRDSRRRPLPDRAASWTALTSARARAGALHSSVASCRPWRCRAGNAHARIAPPPRARRASRLRPRACLASQGSSPSDAHTRAVAKSRKSPPIRLSASEGAPRLNDGSRVNTSVATSESPVVAADERGNALARQPHDRRDGVSLVARRGELPDAADGVPGLRRNDAPGCSRRRRRRARR